MNWKFARNTARTESLLTSEENWDRDERHHKDTDGKPWTIITTFEAPSYEEAKKIADVMRGF